MSNNNDRNGGINGTVAFVTIAVLVGLGIIGSTVIVSVNPDALATFTNNIIIIIGLAVSFVGTVGIVRPIVKKLDTVQSQTNGQLHAKEAEIKSVRSEKDAEIIRLQKRLIEMGGNPHE